MHRRNFVKLLGLVATTARPLAARAQTRDRVRKVAVLMGAAATELTNTYLANFLGRLDELGWREGRNLQSEVRWWSGGPEHMRSVIAELLAFSPDVIMVFSNLAVEVLRPMAGNVPIVFVGVGDPVGAGFVASLGHPGGNITGLSSFYGPIAGKWLLVLKKTAPKLTRVMALLHLETPVHQAFWQAIKEAGPLLGIEVTAGAVHNADEIERAISLFAAGENGGLIVAPHAVTWANEPLIIALSLRHRLPSHFATAGAVKAGGLVSYSHDFEDSFRKTAEQVDRILRGAKPGDLPVQQPMKFKLALNLRSAKVLGLPVPDSLLALADEVFE